MKNSKLRFLSVILAMTLCCSGLTARAYAGGGPEVEEPLPEATVEPGEPLSEGTDIVTRDLLYDKATNKQFITIQDREGHIFYLVIDYDALVNEEEEQFQTYFLNPVDLNDLEALAEENETEPVVCSCTEKCAIGGINTNCPICAANLSECAGKEKKPVEPKPEPQPEPEPEKKAGSAATGPLLVVLLAALGGVGAFVYIKFIRKKPAAKPAPVLDDYDFEDDEDAEDPGYELTPEHGGDSSEESEDE